MIILAIILSLQALLDNFDYSSDEEGDVKLPAPAISNDNRYGHGLSVN